MQHKISWNRFNTYVVVYLQKMQADLFPRSVTIISRPLTHQQCRALVFALNRVVMIHRSGAILLRASDYRLL